jgi:hypothetical protein
MGPADEDDSSFWQDLHALLDTQCSTHEQIDDALRDFLDVSTDGTLDTEYDIARCCYRLIDSPLFVQNKDYVRRQFVYCLLQEEHAPVLHIVTAVLLYDGRSDEAVFEMMQTEAAFPRLLDLIKGNKDDNTGLHRLLLELLCDMSRIQRLSLDDLGEPLCLPPTPLLFHSNLCRYSDRRRRLCHLPVRAHRGAVQRRQ